MSRPRRAVAVLLVALWAPASCGRDGGASACEELRRELDELAPTAVAAWEDIRSLQEDVARGLEIRRRLETECE